MRYQDKAVGKTSEGKIYSLLPSILVLILIMARATLAANSANFPGETKSVSSPDGLLEIKCVDRPRGKGKAPEHQLFLQGSRKPFRSFDRNVDILWSPDSRTFVLNDWTGSNIAESYLYRVGDLEHPININERLLGTVKDVRDRRGLSNCDHLYVFASKWHGPRSLDLKVAVHGCASGAFTIFYVWDLRNAFIRLEKIPYEDCSRDVPAHSKASAGVKHQ